MTRYEYIVIGSGAGGATIARTLVNAGKHVLMLERGDFVPREPQNWSPKDVFQLGRYVSKDEWLDRHGKPFQPQAHYNVGGATKFYGAALLRLRPYDFSGVPHTGGNSTPWPLSYADFEPWYSAAEQLYQVHGNHGEDFTEGPWSQQYPHPALPHEPRIQQLSDQLTAAGYHPFHAPSGVLLQQGGNCIRCSTCDGHPCRVAAKADAETIGIQPLIGNPNFTLVTNAEVLRLSTTDDKRRVSSVVVKQDGTTRTYSADTVILSAGAVNSAKILLWSDLANSSGEVGRNYMCHNSMAVMALGEHPNPTVFQKTLALHDWYYTFGSIQMIGKSTAEAMRGESPHLTAPLPDALLRKVASHAIDFWLMTEDLPLAENRVRLDASGRVRLLKVTQTGYVEMHGLYMKLKEIMHRAGMTEVFAKKDMPLAAVAHQAGTCKMGTDPASSVLDPFCKAHDLDNLYVVDASFMPSVGAVNPALTVIANALRVGSHLLGQ